MSRSRDNSLTDEQRAQTPEKNDFYISFFSTESTPESTPDISPRPTSSYHLTDDRAAQIRQGLCQRIIRKGKIPQKDYHLLIALLSSEVASEQYLQERQKNLMLLRESDQAFTIIRMFIDKAWKMTQEYELVLWSEETNLRGQDFSIALSLGDNNVIQYSTSAMVQGRNYLHKLDEEALTTEEYQALSEAILAGSFESLNNKIKLKLTSALYAKSHLLAKDREDCFNDLGSDFLSFFKRAIQFFFTDGSNFTSQNSGLTEEVVSSLRELHKTIQKFDPEYQKSIVEGLAIHSSALQNIETLEEGQRYLKKQKARIDELSLEQADEIDEQMPQYENDTRARSATLGHLMQSTPFKGENENSSLNNSSSESLIVFSENTGNFNTPAKEASRKTICYIKENPNYQEKLFNVNSNEKPQEKQRLLNTLLDQEALYPDQIHASAWFIANGAMPERGVFKKSQRLLYAFLRNEEQMLREEEARSEWVQQVNTALLQVTQYVNEELDKLDKKDVENTDSAIKNEKTKLKKKLKAVHQAIEDIHQGKSVTQTLNALQNNTIIAEKRGFFKSNTLKKVEKISLKLASSEPVPIEKGIQGLAKACLTLREQKLQKISEREEKVKLAVVLLERVASHIRAKLNSVFASDKETLRKRLQAIEAAKDELDKINENKKQEISHEETNRDSGDFSVKTIPIDSSSNEPETTDSIFARLTNNDAIKTQRFWLFKKEKTETETLIEAAHALVAPAA